MSNDIPPKMNNLSTYIHFLQKHSGKMYNVACSFKLSLFLQRFLVITLPIGMRLLKWLEWGHMQKWLRSKTTNKAQ